MERWDGNNEDTAESGGFDPSTADFVPCPLCKQYSHSIGTDELAQAFLHFESMSTHPLHGRPMGFIFDQKTRNAMQLLMAAARHAVELADALGPFARIKADNNFDLLSYPDSVVIRCEATVGEIRAARAAML